MDIVSQLVSQPWALPVLVGVAALLLGLLIPRRGGASWLSGIIFFLPNLFLDFLDMVHTKKFKYYGLITALLAIEAFFAFRAATVYYDVLNAHMPGPEMAIVCVIVFVAVFLCGYMVATHGKLTFWSGCTMVFVVFHDWTGTFWMNYSQPILAATGSVAAAASVSGQSSNDGLKLALTIGMCVLGILPFIMGAWAEELRPQLEKELDEEVDAFTSTATRKIKRRAVERVLRLANHTNIVHLVRALPADEFLDFKKFVMPIIAPGTAYNLPEQMSDEQPQSGQNGDSKDRQDHAILAEEKLLEHVPNDQPKTRQDGSQNGGQNGSQKPAIGTAKSSPESGQNGSQKPASQATKRDAKIRQFAAENPAMTRAKMAKRFGVSTRTLARILAGQKDMPQQPENGMSSISTNQAPASTNGHHQMAERDTEKLESVSVRGLTLAHRN